MIDITPRRAIVLQALYRQPGQKIEDPDGQATTLLMAETGHRTTNALSGVLLQLDQAGLITREIGGRRTYSIALTAKGRREAEKLGVEAPAPQLPASAEPLARAVEDAPRLDTDGVDLDLLAGVLLKKALLATQAQEQAAASRDAEARAAELEAELRTAQSQVSELRAAVKTLEHNNQVLASQIDKVKSSPGTPIKDLISRQEQKELEKLMRALPTTRG